MIYVTLPGFLERSPDHNGNGIVVLDAKNNYNFVKRIPVFDVPASQNPEQIAGVTASPVTQMIYVAARGRLAAIDLTTDKRSGKTPTTASAASVRRSPRRLVHVRGSGSEELLVRGESEDGRADYESAWRL